MELLPRAFFEDSPEACARGLIGARLNWGECAGVVVETEAYDEVDDPACHTFFRPSARVFVEEHPAGTAYVYLNYGVHWLINALVKGKRRGFVLIRAIEPVAGVEQMEKRRGLRDGRKLCAGPGRLTQALGIDGTAHGKDLCADPNHGFLARPRRPRIVADGRIGISIGGEVPWRFTLAGSHFVSRKPLVGK